MKVLIADDDDMTRDFVSMVLESGFDAETFEVGTAGDAISVLMGEDDLDMVISEYKMGKGTGYEIYRYIKENRLRIPFVLFTSSKQDKCMDFIGFLNDSPLNAFLSKPYKDAEFLQVVEKLQSFEGEIPIPGEKKSAGAAESDSAEASESDSSDWDNLDIGDFVDPEDKAKAGSTVDWSVKKKGPKGMQDADWNVPVKGDAGTVKADWELKHKGDAGTVKADWDLKKNGDAGTQKADWDLKKGDAGTEKADWGLTKEGSSSTSMGFVTQGNEDGMTTSDQQGLLNDQEGEASTEQSDDNPSEEASKEDHNVEGYRKIKISRFYNFHEVPCEVSVKLSKAKMVKVIHENDPYGHDLVDKYVERGLKYLYIEEKKYPEFSNVFLQQISSRVSKTQGNAIAKTTGDIILLEAVAEQARELGLTEVGIEQANKIMTSSLKLFEKQPDILDFLNKVVRGTNYISEHSLLLNYIITQISIFMSWNSDALLEKFSIAALLHDVALEDDELARVHDLSHAKSKKLSRQQLSTISSHPGEAVKIIANANDLPADVDTLILQHHERPDGKGYPRGLTALNIAPITAVFIIGHEMADYVFAKKSGVNDIDPKTFIANMEQNFHRGNFKKPLDAFKKAFSKSLLK